MLDEDGAVVGCVGDEEDHPGGRPIAPLERAASVKRLQVVQPCFRLDRHLDRIQPEHRIPGAPMAWDRERNLSPHSHMRWQLRPQAVQERELAAVECWIVARYGAHVEPQAHGFACPAELQD